MKKINMIQYACFIALLTIIIPFNNLFADAEDVTYYWSTNNITSSNDEINYT